MVEYQGKEVILMACSSCNIKRCEHCYISYEGDRNPDDLKRLVSTLIDNYKVYINGAEVLVNKEYFDSYKIAHQNWMLTNGFEIYRNPDILDYLKDELEKAKANPKTYKATLKKLTIRYYTILLLATTGIRANECISIRMSDVNIDSGSIDIRGKGYEGEVSRKVYLPSNIKEAFIEYLSCDLFESDREYLFPALRGYKNSITTQTINVWLNEVGDELGLKLHPHLFRHSYATNKIQSNPNSLETISKVLGHKSSTITSKYYIGENKEDIQSLMQIEDYK